MHVLDSWKQSRSFFERKNLSVFGLVTLKAIATVYSQIVSYLFVPLCVLVLVDMLIPYKGMHILHIAFLIFVYLTVRSSVQRKDWRYYAQYVKHGIYLLIWLFLVFFILSIIGYWWWAFVTVFVTFAIFFFLDSRPTIANFLASQMRAVNMIIYNAPVCLVIASCLMISWWIYMLVVQLICHFIPLSIAWNRTI